MADNVNPNPHNGSHSHGQNDPFIEDAPTEIAPSAYSAPAGYDSPTQTAGPGHVQQNVEWASYPSSGGHRSGQGYATGPQQHYQTTPYPSVQQYGGAHVPTAAPAQRRNIAAWVIGGILAVAAIAGFGLVWFFLPNKTSSTTAASTPTSSVSTPASSNSAATTPSSSDPTGTFPVEANGSCSGTGSVPSDMRVVGNTTSCQYIEAIDGQIINAISQNPSTTEFGVSAYSNAVYHEVNLTCTRSEHISHCLGGKQVNLYVQDSIK